VPVERHHVTEHVCCVLVVPVLPPPKLQIFILFISKKELDSMRSGQLRGQKSDGPLEKPLEMADYVFCPHKKITPPTLLESAVY
jgi:hypothetical protein